jgi:hypothetical protein
MVNFQFVVRRSNVAKMEHAMAILRKVRARYLAKALTSTGKAVARIHLALA